jgi:hypothetical protein
MITPIAMAAAAVTRNSVRFMCFLSTDIPEHRKNPAESSVHS